MKLIDRYVEAVQRQLPAGIRGDVGTELKDILQEKVEAVAQRDHHTPSEEEVAQVLREHGHPYAVALAYHSRRALISERAYPLYRLVLGRTLALYLLVAAGLALLRIGQYQGSWGLALVPDFLGAVWTALLVGWIIITALFHYFGDQMASSPFFWRWDPKSLPEVPDSWANISLPGACTAVVTTVIGLCLLILPQSFTLAGAQISIDPAAYNYLFPLRLLLFGLLVLYALNLFQLYWTRLKLMASGVLELGVAACWTGIVLTAPIFHLGAGPNAVVPLIPNTSLRVTAAIVAAVALYNGLISLFRAIRKPVPLL